MEAPLTEGLRTIKKADGAKAKDEIAAAGSPFRDHHQVIPLSPQPQFPAESGIFYCPKSDGSSAYRRTEDNKKSSRSESEG